MVFYFKIKLEKKLQYIFSFLKNKKDREEALSPKTKVKNWLVTSKPGSPVSVNEMNEKLQTQTSSKTNANLNLNQQKVN